MNTSFVVDSVTAARNVSSHDGHFDISKCLLNKTCAELLNHLLINLKRTTAETTHDLVLQIGGPCVLLIGTIGNVLSLVCLWKFFLKKTFYIYLFVLTFSDILVLYFGLFERWLQEVSNFTLRETPTGCKIITYCCYTFSFMSAWLIVAANIDRFTAIYFEFNNLHQRRRQRTIIVIIVISVLSILIPLHIFWTVDVEDDLVLSCRDSSKSSPFLWELWSWVDMCLYFFIPFVLISTMNGMILRKIWHRKIEKDERNIQSSRQTSGCCLRSKHPCISRITVLLMTISVSFLFTTSPYIGAVVFHKTWPTTEDNSNSHIDDMQIMYSAFELLMYLNHSINFYLYCLCGKQVRGKLVAVLTRSKRHNHNQRSAETTL